MNGWRIGVMDKIGVKNRCSPYAAKLYKKSKPLNTKNAFFAAQNRSGKMAPKWQTTLQMRVLSQAFQRWAKAKS